MVTHPVFELSKRRTSAIRYRLHLPAIFHWNDGGEHTGCGFTNDVGVDGVSIVCTKNPPVGTNVRVEVLLPSPSNNAEDIRIECQGKVVSIHDAVPCSTFGVQGTFNEYYLADPDGV